MTTVVRVDERVDPRCAQRDAKCAYGTSTLAFKNVAFSLADGRRILDNVSGSYSCGEMAAIMGPSGSGKTTLLDIIAGKKTTAYTGEVFLNGSPRDELFARLTSYVPQQDILPAHLTVYEAVKFVHELRVETAMSEREREEAVLQTLELLGLREIKDQLIGDARVRGISGGQKRRVTLARGLAGGSQIVFADEPTSGLSSTDAETVTRAMCLAAKRMGVIFVTVIHQPRAEVADMFDSLILLTSSPGRCVYNGAFADAASYFAAAGSPVPSRANPADFFLDVITPGAHGERSNHFAALYEEKQAGVVAARVAALLEAPKKSPMDVLRETAKVSGLSPEDVHESPIAARFATQLRVLMKRKLTITRRNKTGLRLRFGVSLMQGLIVGMAFYGIGDKLPVQQLSFFFMLLQMGALANMAIMPELIETRLQLKLEQSDALYSSGASIVTQSAVNNALAIAGNFITSIIMFSFSKISWSNFGILYGWGLLSFMTVTNYLRVIAAVAPSPSESVQAAMPGLLLFILFNNFFVNRATAPAFMKWLIYVSPMAWAIEQIVTGIYGENAELVALYGYDGSDARTVTAVGVLLCEMAFFQTLEIFLLKRTNAIVR